MGALAACGGQTIPTDLDSLGYIDEVRFVAR